MSDNENIGFFQKHKKGTTIAFYLCFIPWVLLFLSAINGAFAGASFITETYYGWEGASLTMMVSFILLGAPMIGCWIYQLIYAVQNRQIAYLFTLYTAIFLVAIFILVEANIVMFFKNPITWASVAHLTYQVIKRIKTEKKS